MGVSENYVIEPSLRQLLRGFHKRRTLVPRRRRIQPLAVLSEEPPHVPISKNLVVGVPMIPRRIHPAEQREESPEAVVKVGAGHQRPIVQIAALPAGSLGPRCPIEKGHHLHPPPLPPVVLEDDFVVAGGGVNRNVRGNPAKFPPHA